MKKWILLLVCNLSLWACGQHTNQKQEIIQTKKSENMDTSKLTNLQVKKAIEAQINNDKTAFFELFSDSVKFIDDGNSLDFKPFFENAFSHQEQFLSIDKVENDGLDIFGKFNAGQWGVFPVYFKFRMNKEGKFNELHIGNNSK